MRPARLLPRSRGQVARGGIRTMLGGPGTIWTGDVSDTVSISRDKRGIPHIVAANVSDALFGLGYATAQDRLFQMDLVRRSALGRLSEIAGPSTLATDRLMRAVGIHRIAHDIVNCQSPAGQSALRAFSAGVNAWIAHGRLPLAFRVLRYRPEPWRPEDSVAIVRFLGWSLSDFHEAEIALQAVRDGIGDAWADAIFAGVIPDEQLVVRDVPHSPSTAMSTANTVPFPSGGGSNAWAISGSRSVTGGPLLASDPHLTYTNPSVWYEASIEAPGLRVHGMTMPGTPGILIGRTPTFAWGFTAAMIGQSFLYRERLRTDNSSVLRGSAVEPITTRTEEIRVRGQHSEYLTIRSTPRGPLLSEIEPRGIASPYSLYWTGSEPGYEIDGILALNQARSVDDALASRGLLTVPAVNLVAADADGSIAMATLGRIANRQQHAGLLDAEQFPPTYIAPNALPLDRDPDRGWVAQANDPLRHPVDQHILHGFYEPGYRISRIGTVLDSRATHSVADMQALQLDQLSLHAAEFVSVMLDLAGDALPDWVGDDLRGWDFEVSADSRPALLFQVLYHQWLRHCLAARLPDDLVQRLLELLPVGNIPRGFCDRVLAGDVPQWADDDERRALMRRVCDDALAWLRDRLGTDPMSWTWGRVHTATFVHPLGQGASPLRRFVNVGPLALGGDRTTVWPSNWRMDDPFDITGGPSMRFIADMRGVHLTWTTNTLGESGNPLSRHARDQVGDFVSGRMRRLTRFRLPATTIRPRSQ